MSAIFSFTSALIAGAGVGAMMTAAPVVAAPFAAGLAIVTSGFIFTTSAVSVPVLSGLIAAGAIVSFGGRTVLDRGIGHIKERYRKQISEELERRVLSADPDSKIRSLFRVLADEIDAAAQVRLEQLA